MHEVIEAYILGEKLFWGDEEFNKRFGWSEENGKKCFCKKMNTEPLLDAPAVYLFDHKIQFFYKKEYHEQIREHFEDFLDRKIEFKQHAVQELLSLAKIQCEINIYGNPYSLVRLFTNIKKECMQIRMNALITNSTC